MHRDYTSAQEQDQMPTLEHHTMAPASAAAQNNLCFNIGGTVLNRTWPCLGFLTAHLLVGSDSASLLF